MHSLSARVGRRIKYGLKSNPVTMAVNRARRDPFIDSKQRLIMHTAHHKVGTRWFASIFRALSMHFGIPLVTNTPEVLSDNGRATLFLQHQVYTPHTKFKGYRGSHMIRDPRDIAVSGYHYHLWTTETWANQKIATIPNAENIWFQLPVKDIGHLTYREYLNSLSAENGLLAEIKRCSCNTFSQLHNWDYEDDDTFEFRYEDILLDEESLFAKVFEHYGFNQGAIDQALSIANRFTFSNQATNTLGTANEGAHLRSGALQQWKQEFSNVHSECFKRLAGDTLIKLGYEVNFDW